MLYTELFKKYDSKDKSILPDYHGSRVGASLAVQIHSTGARPAFTLNRQQYKPEGYDSRFDALFRTRILNRHPNESDELYNWRLSVYSPISKEIYDRFKNFMVGCILQPNSYFIQVDGDRIDEYVHSIFPDKMVEALEYILVNPNGIMAVIVNLDYDGEVTSEIKPEFVMVDVEKIIMQDNESIAFIHKDKIIYLNNTLQVVRDIEEKTIPIEIPHNFGVLPYWDVENSFAQPFISWADQLGRNFSDDEMMTKQYSYPIKQVIEAQCGVCSGTGSVSKQEKEIWIQSRCESCNGKGVMSINPGEHYTITEEKLYKSGLTSMPDMAKFITPDVEIPKYHFERWQKFYERAEKALYLSKKINGTESGDAKREDRRDQYVQIATISRFLFEQIKKAISFIARYRNYNGSSGEYESSDIIVMAPKQFDLMSDADLVAEMIDTQGKTTDTMICAEVQYAVTSKIYRDDAVQMKINDVLYQVDPLYGITGQALQSKYLSGIYTTQDKVIHEKGYKILLQISIQMGKDRFADTTAEQLTIDLMNKVSELTPATIYD